MEIAIFTYFIIENFYTLVQYTLKKKKETDKGS